MIKLKKVNAKTDFAPSFFSDEDLEANRKVCREWIENKNGAIHAIGFSGITFALGATELDKNDLLWISYRSKDGVKYANPISLYKQNSHFINELNSTYKYFQGLANKDETYV